MKVAAGAKLWDDARRWGKAADDLAARTTPPGDPARARNALALADVQWSIAGAAKDVRTALLWSDDAIRIALEAGDLDGARRRAARGAEAADGGARPGRTRPDSRGGAARRGRLRDRPASEGP